MNSPIAEQTRHDMHKQNEYVGIELPENNPDGLYPNQVRLADIYPEPSPERDIQRSKSTRNADIMATLVNIQQDLIRAYHNFLHDGDVRDLLIAQQKVMQCQMEMVLDKVGTLG